MRHIRLFDVMLLNLFASGLEALYRELAVTPVLPRHVVRIILFFGYFGMSGMGMHEVAVPANYLVVVFSTTSGAIHLSYLWRSRRATHDEWTFKRYRAAVLVQQRAKAFVEARLFNICLSIIVLGWLAYAYRDGPVTLYCFATNLAFIARIAHLYIEACDLPRPFDGGIKSGKRFQIQTAA
jgi:hypothetical protein